MIIALIKDFINEKRFIPRRIKNIINEIKLRRKIVSLARGKAEAYSSFQSLGGNTVFVGEWTYIGPYSKVHTFSNHDAIVTIGKFCSIADNVRILPGGEHHHKTRVANFPLKTKLLNMTSNPDVLSKGPIIIGNDVWIGSHVILLSGVTIGDGAVIGAGTIVTKNIPPYSIVVGNPYIVIGFRFSENIIKKLLEIKWWDWDEKLIIDRINDFYIDVEAFVKKYYI